MSASYVANVKTGFYPDPNEPVMESIFQQYERVLVESIISSFGLDFLVHDQHGGDVDTVHNVRQIGQDAQMTYKNSANQKAYQNRGQYNTKEYHSGTAFQSIKHEARDNYRRTGQTVKDAYTGSQLHFLGKTTKENTGVNAELDHVISAKKIHDDPGRVLAGLSGKDLANSKENLAFTNAGLNRSMQDKEIPDYINAHPELSPDVKENLMQQYRASKKSYESKIQRAYYTSPKFAKDLALAAGNVSVRMGTRQALGFVFAEMWFSVKEEFQKFHGEFNFGEFLKSLGYGIKRGFERAKEKYHELFSKFLNGAVAGALSSLTTTLCNIFFTTAKNTVKIIRQSYASLVEAGKILFINPDNYTFGERMRAVVKALATGASVVTGVIVSEALSKTPVSAIPVVGDVVQSFCGAFVTGIMSCTLLYFFDRNELMQRLFQVIDNIHTVETEVAYFRQQAMYFERYAAELMNIDLGEFKKETVLYRSVAKKLEAAQTEQELNSILRQALQDLGISLPWQDGRSFDEFMGDKNARLLFR